MSEDLKSTEPQSIAEGQGRGSFLTTAGALLFGAAMLSSGVRALAQTTSNKKDEKKTHHKGKHSKHSKKSKKPAK